MNKVRRRADAACCELLQGHFGRIKMMDDATLMARSGLFVQKGCLALLNDRLIFQPYAKGETLEMPLTGISSLAMSKAGILSFKKLVVVADGRQFNFDLNPEIAGVWKLALEKLSLATVAKSGG